jgi:hypothetical protein
MTTALSGQQMALPVWVGAHSCLSFGHSAWLTPWLWHVKTLCAAHEGQEPELVMCIFSEELADARLKSRGPLRTAFINP